MQMKCHEPEPRTEIPSTKMVILPRITFPSEKVLILVKITESSSVIFHINVRLVTGEINA